MKKAILFLAVTFGVSVGVQAQELKVKSDKAKIEFFVVSDKQEGEIGGFEATIKFNPSDPSSSSIKGSVDVKTIDTGSKMRDNHLKNEDYFDVEKYPKMKFESNSISQNDDGSFTMKGSMTIKDITKPVTFKFDYKNKKFEGKATIYGTDFKVGHGWKEREKSKIYIKVNIPVE